MACGLRVSVVGARRRAGLGGCCKQEERCRGTPIARGGGRLVFVLKRSGGAGRQGSAERLGRRRWAQEAQAWHAGRRSLVV